MFNFRIADYSGYAGQFATRVSLVVRSRGGITITAISRRARYQLSQTFASLKYPNFRLWFFGQMFSLMGSWMQSTAQGYLIYELTKSPAYLGYVGFFAGMPSWFFTLYAGVIADRFSRRQLLIIVQSMMMLLAIILAGLTFMDWVQPWHILVLAFLLGTANAFDAPTRQAFILEMIEREDLTNAIALNSTMFTSAIVVGPAIGGLTYAAFGPGWCFMINAISFLAVLAALALMRLKPFEVRPSTKKAREELFEGLTYVLSNPTIRMLIVNLAAVGMIGLGFATLIPAWAVKVLGGDSVTNGYLLSARGLGSLLGSLMIATLSRYNLRGLMWTVGSFVFPIILLVFALIRWLPLSLLALVGVGWGVLAMLNNTNALVQSLVPDELRGRVMGVYILVFFGSTPIGSLLAGWMAAKIGEPMTVVISSLLLLAFALWMYFFRPQMRALR